MKDQETSGGKYENVSLDDALAHTGFGVFNILNVLISGLILLGVITETLGLSYVIPLAQCDLALTTTSKGLIGAIPFIGIIVTAHMWGWLSDTRGRKPIVMFSMAVSVVLSISSTFSPNLWVFATIRFIAAILKCLHKKLGFFIIGTPFIVFSIAGPQAIMYAYIGESNSIHYRDNMVAFGSSFVGLATLVMPSLSWMIAPLEINWYIPFLDITFKSWRLLLVMFAMPYFISTIALYFLPESPKFLYSSGKEEECLQVLETMYSINTRKRRDFFPVKSLVQNDTPKKEKVNEGALKEIWISVVDQTVPLFKAPYLRYTLLAFFVQFGIFSTANGFYFWFPAILNTIASSESEQQMSVCSILVANQNITDVNLECDDSVNTNTYFLSIIMAAVLSMVYLISATIINRVGKKLLIVVILITSGICGIVSCVIPIINVAILFFAAFFISGAAIGITNACVVELFPTNLRSMAISLSMMMGRVGAVISSNLIGYILEIYCPLSFYLFGSLLVVCGLLCLTLPNQKVPLNSKPLSNSL